MKKILVIISLLLQQFTVYSQNTNLFVFNKLVNNQYKYGYMDSNGKVKIPAIYTEAQDFSEGLACVFLNDKCAYIDVNGNTIIPFNYSYASPFRHGFAQVSSANSTFYINKKNEILQPNLKNIEIISASENRLLFTYEEKSGFLNSKGEILIEPIFKKAFPFKNGRTFVKKDNSRWFLIDSIGKVIFETVFEPIENFSEGMAPVLINNKLGYIDSTGLLCIPAKYDKFFYEANHSFQDGIAQVFIDNQTSWYDPSRWRSGFINKKGQTIIPITYAPTSFVRRKDFIPIENNWHKTMFLNSKGDTLKSLPDSVFLSFFNGEVGFVGKTFKEKYEHSRFALINKNGEMLTEMRFTEYFQVSEGLIVTINLEGKYEIIDTQGKTIFITDETSSNNEDVVKFKDGIVKLQLFYNNKNDNDNNAQTVAFNRNGKKIWISPPWYLCFPAESQIRMADGSQKPINQVKAGEFVMARNAENGELFPSIVSKNNCYYGNFDISTINIQLPEQYYAGINTYLPNKHISELSATNSHPIFTENGIKKFGNLNKNDRLFLFNSLHNSLAKVTCQNIQINRYKVHQVFSLQTKAGNYFVNDILVKMK